MSGPVKLAILVSKWGELLAVESRARGHDTVVIAPSETITPEAVAAAGYWLFARLPQHNPEPSREWALRFIRAGGRCVQSKADLVLYEDRAQQMHLLQAFYPRGMVVTDTEPETIDRAMAVLGLPIVSKARFGSSSHTVRLLHSKQDIQRELREVFARPGKAFPSKVAGVRYQYGECLWQAFVHRNDYALRIARVSKEYGWVFKVMNRAHDWRASGSGVCVPVTGEELDSPKMKQALATFLLMADEKLQSNWCAADLLYDHIAGLWLVVDVTLAWNLSRHLAGGNYDAPIINLRTREPHPKGYRGRDQWALLLDTLEEGRW